MSSDIRTVTVTGANGFIGRNLCLRLAERGIEAVPVTRATGPEERRRALSRSQAVFHLAGENRPADPAGFMAINRDFAVAVAGEIAASGTRPLVIVASTTRAAAGDDYGSSKRAGEEAMQALGDTATVSIWRLPNVFGKWARPNYNSVVATFCHNLAHGLPLRIDDPPAPLTLLYVDDLIDQWLALLDGTAVSGIVEPGARYRSTVGQLAATLERIAASRSSLDVVQVGAGFERALYATYLSYLPANDFSYPLVSHEDRRGSFCEFLRTPASGQVSVLTAHPGETRGGHYHHTKAERFLVVHGRARFRFRHVLTGETLELLARADEPRAVETIPGWAHDVTNVGEDELVALLWASETFDPARPDTVGFPL